MHSNVSLTKPDGEVDNNVSTTTSGYTCIICRGVLETEVEYESHLKRCGQPEYQCTICCKSFKSKQAIMFHEESHKDAREQYSCDLCQKVYKSKTALKAHQISVHVDDSNVSLGKSKVCQECGQKFSNHSSMLRHLAVHGPAPHHCEECNRSFNQKDKYKHHMKTVHLGVAYKCTHEGCEKSFRTTTGLKYHMSK